MQRAKTFFYVCAGLFLLALSWHLGVRSVTAKEQSGRQISGVAAVQLHGEGVQFVAVATNGDSYLLDGPEWKPLANIFAGQVGKSR